MSEWIESWSWSDAPNARRCVLCGGDLVFWNSDIESSVHDHCGARCRIALDILASNLAVAGALCASWSEGWRYGMSAGMAQDDDETVQERLDRYCWRPGCGRNAGGGEQ